MNTLLLPIFLLQLINCSNLITAVQAAQYNNNNAFQVISENPELSMFKNLIGNDTAYSFMLKSWKMTVFVPTNQAIKMFLERNSQQQLVDGFNSDLLQYHLVSATIKRESWTEASPANALNGQFPPLYLTTTDYNPYKPDEKSYFVNNAFVIEAIEDLQGNGPNAEGQALYIIDEVLSSLKPNRPTAPTALELLKEPSIYGLDNFDMSKFLQKVQEKQLESIFSTPGTFFIPTKVASRGTPEFDEYVVKAHVIKDKPLFIRTMGDRRSYNTMAFDDNVDVELSFINKTVRFTVEQMYYIQTNTIKNDAIHKAGRVLSRMIKANIPVKNGVVHIIDKPLMLMDMAIRDFLREQNKLKRFYKLLEKHPDVLSNIGKNSNKTVLAPDDNAFANLMDNNQNFAGISEDSDEMKKLLLNHVVYQQVSFSDLKRSAGFANYTSANGVPVMFRLVGTDSNARLTVESGGVNATSSLSDLGASDGILHIIDRVLGMPFNTIYEKLINNPMLNETFKIGSQGGTQNWNSKLLDKNKRYTFFAPSNTAWMEFDRANPSEFKQLDQGIYPSISRAILDRHISAKGQYNKKDLEQTVKKVDTIQGELNILPDPTTREIYIEWEGTRAKIISSDIHGLNGVIHIIDKVLAKKRDLKVNAAINGQSYCHLFVYLIMGLVSIMFTQQLR
ncbi:fasciclin-1-like protein [Dermatophagoides farinae]|nr:fasciclin-1-like [Dermatophagoides farinae]KAH7643632.1 fasciclin-1-like protein [Dermatophagoides farinae]